MSFLMRQNFLIRAIASTRLGRVSLLAGLAFAVALGARAEAQTKPKPEAEVKPHFADYLAGRAAKLDRDWRTAGQLTFRAWQADPDDVSLRHDALLLSVAGGDFPNALQVAKVVPADSSDMPLANFVLMLDDLLASRWTQAETRLAAAPAHGPDRYLAPIMTAWCEVARGRKTEALAALAQMDAIGGTGELKNLQAAMIADALGDKAQATAFYDKMMDGKAPLHLITMAAAFYQRQGAVDKARDAIEKLDADGASASLRTELLARLADKSRIAPAPDAKFGSADALFTIAVMLNTQPQQADIAPLLYTQFALRLWPDFPSAQLLLAEIEQRFGRLDDAAAALLSVDPKSEMHGMAQRMAMAVLDKAGDGDRAMKVGQAAVKAHPADLDLLLTYADLLREKSHYPEAIATYDAVLAKVSPTSNRKGMALYHRGIAYQQAKQWPKAEADLLAALQLRPDDPSLLNYLAFSWADMGVNLDRARTMLERAIQLEPDDGAIIDSLGWVMYRAGDYDDAIKQLEHAVALDANDATITDHLGDAYWKVGRQLDARSQWEKASHMTDDKTLAEQLRIKLRDGLVQETTTPANRAAVN